MVARPSPGDDPNRAPVSAPFFVEQEAATGAPVPGVWPRPGVTDLKLANRHLEYALTWWGLAATLIGVYLAFAWTRFKALRQPRAN